MSESSALPNHIGIVLDGNRRWAREQGLPVLEGHSQGSEVFREIALETFDRGIKYLSAWVFSTENWSRTEEEVSFLMNLVVKATEKYLDTFNKAGIKIIILGRRDRLSDKVLKSIEQTEEKTRHNTKGTLALCFNYGGREEITDTVKRLISSGVTSEEVTTETVRQNLYNPEIPDVDLLIRTSGEQRTSGYMLYRADYAELYFIKKHWPDFSIADLDEAIAEFAKRQRRFGK